ncbi:MAG: hypothetical protein Q8R24_02520 [Legionellaceae bacterium]|nr:hypothetical protein [Legionellaceae bacterium]
MNNREDIISNHPLRPLSDFCDKHKEAWWFRLFFPTTLSVALSNLRSEENVENKLTAPFQAFFAYRTWLGVLNFFKFFDGPDLIKTIDESPVTILCKHCYDGNTGQKPDATMTDDEMNSQYGSKQTLQLNDTNYHVIVQKASNPDNSNSESGGEISLKPIMNAIESEQNKRMAIVDFLQKHQSSNPITSEDITKLDSASIELLSKLLDSIQKQPVVQSLAVIENIIKNNNKDLLIIFAFLVKSRRIVYPQSASMEKQLLQDLLKLQDIQLWVENIAAGSANSMILYNQIISSQDKQQHKTTKQVRLYQDNYVNDTSVNGVNQDAIFTQDKQQGKTIEQVSRYQNTTSDNGVSQKVSKGVNDATDSFPVAKSVTVKTRNSLSSIDRNESSTPNRSAVSKVKEALVIPVNSTVSQVVDGTTTIASKAQPSGTLLEDSKANEELSEKKPTEKMKESQKSANAYQRAMDYFSNTDIPYAQLNYLERSMVTKGSEIDHVFEVLRQVAPDEKLWLDVFLDPPIFDMFSKVKSESIDKVKHCMNTFHHIDEMEIPSNRTSSINTSIRALTKISNLSTNWSVIDQVISILEKSKIPMERWLEIMENSNLLKTSEADLSRISSILEDVSSFQLGKMSDFLTNKNISDYFIKNMEYFLSSKDSNVLLFSYESINQLTRFKGITENVISRIIMNNNYLERWGEVELCLGLLFNIDPEETKIEEKLEKLMQHPEIIQNLSEIVLKNKKALPKLLNELLGSEDLKHAVRFIDQDVLDCVIQYQKNFNRDPPLPQLLAHENSEPSVKVFEKLIGLYKKTDVIRIQSAITTLFTLTQAQQEDVYWCLKVLQLPCNSKLLTVENLCAAIDSAKSHDIFSDLKNMGCGDMFSGQRPLDAKDLNAIFIRDNPDLIAEMGTKYTSVIESVNHQVASQVSHVVSGAVRRASEPSGLTQQATETAGQMKRRASVTAKNAINSIKKVTGQTISSSINSFYSKKSENISESPRTVVDDSSDNKDSINNTKGLN